MAQLMASRPSCSCALHLLDPFRRLLDPFEESPGLATRLGRRPEVSLQGAAARRLGPLGRFNSF